MKFYDSLPKGAFKATYEVEVYRLKYRKKRSYPDNIELRPNLRHLIWSVFSRCYFERVIDDTTLDENLLYYLKKGWLYLYPDQDTIEEIREEIEKDGLSYRELMFRRENELQWYRIQSAKATGNGDRYYEQLYKKQFQQFIKTKKT